MTGPFAHTPLQVAREAQHMSKTASERDAMLLQKVAVGAMFAMALPCALSAVREVFKLLNFRESEKEPGRHR